MNFRIATAPAREIPRTRPGLIRSGLTFALCSGLLLVASIPAVAQNQIDACGDLQNAYGPYDYRTDRDKLPIVERFHFTPEVETLIRGNTGLIGGDIDYTLRAFPNHHRALISMIKLGERTKSRQPPGAKYTVECYFDRAIRFKPDDTIVRMIFATYLNKNGHEREAIQQLDEGAKLAGDDPFAHYNAGLLYFDMKIYDKALQQAQVAYALGFPRPALRESLTAIGKWVDSPAHSASAPASTPVADTDRVVPVAPPFR